LRKVKVGVFINEDLMARFRKLIMEKYSKYEKGLLSYEVENALRYWIALHTNAQNTMTKNKPNPTPKVISVWMQVKEYLLKNWYMELIPGQQIARVHLEKAITAVRGGDRRTIDKWLNIFVKMGLVKPITSATWEII
jgi:hypothetical protein